MQSKLIVLSAAFATLLASGCNTYSQSLQRSREAYEGNQYDRSLAILRALEPDEAHLTADEQGEYAYLRGMTDYRIGYQQDARHWLSVAAALDKTNPKALNEDWKARLAQVLEELNKQVYNEGLDSLSNAQATDDRGDDRKSDSNGKRGGKKPAAKPDSDKTDKSDKTDNGDGKKKSSEE